MLLAPVGGKFVWRLNLTHVLEEATFEVLVVHEFGAYAIIRYRRRPCSSGSSLSIHSIVNLRLKGLVALAVVDSVEVIRIEDFPIVRVHVFPDLILRRLRVSLRLLLTVVLIIFLIFQFHLIGDGPLLFKGLLNQESFGNLLIPRTLAHACIERFMTAYQVNIFMLYQDLSASFVIAVGRPSIGLSRPLLITSGSVRVERVWIVMLGLFWKQSSFAAGTVDKFICVTLVEISIFKLGDHPALVFYCVLSLWRSHVGLINSN